MTARGQDHVGRTTFDNLPGQAGVTTDLSEERDNKKKVEWVSGQEGLLRTKFVCLVVSLDRLLKSFTVITMKQEKTRATHLPSLLKVDG